jgi:hypothetical protein
MAALLEDAAHICHGLAPEPQQICVAAAAPLVRMPCVSLFLEASLLS